MSRLACAVRVPVALALALACAPGVPAAPAGDPDRLAARLKYRACAAAHREEGVALCREALEAGLGPGRAALAQLLLARDLIALERWDEALAAHREVLRLRPDDPDAARRLGLVLLHAFGRPDDAEVYLRQALAGRPDAATHVDLGLALNALGRHEEAMGEFRVALDLDPDALADRPAAVAVYAASQRAGVWP